MKQLLSAELGQRQTISPQVYQSLNILQMNTVQVDEYINEAALENPVLEVEEHHRDSALQSLENFSRPINWEWDFSGGWWEEDKSQTRELRAPDSANSLREHLAAQFFYALDREEIRLLGNIMDHMDENGYLTATRKEIAALSGFQEEYIGYGIAYLQSLDPLGVCSQDLTECLSVQLERLGYRDPALFAMVREHLPDIAAGHFNKIAKALGRTPEEIRSLCEVIRELNPKPGAPFGELTAPVLVPDIIVTVENGRVLAEVRGRGSRKVGISSYYARIAKTDEYGEAAAYLEEKMAQAKWLIGALESRESTLQQIADMIATHQQAFFLAPAGELQPLTLKEVAQSLELHESTISRAISGKYLQCGRGSFPIKHFFPARVGDERGGGSTSNNAVKNRIKALVEAEDKASPLSDSAIVAILAEEGIRLSRRVISKYRGELLIPGSSARKVQKGT